MRCSGTGGALAHVHLVIVADYIVGSPSTPSASVSIPGVGGGSHCTVESSCGCVLNVETTNWSETEYVANSVEVNGMKVTTGFFNHTALMDPCWRACCNGKEGTTKISFQY